MGYYDYRETFSTEERLLRAIFGKNIQDWYRWSDSVSFETRNELCENEINIRKQILCDIERATDITENSLMWLKSNLIWQINVITNMLDEQREFYKEYVQKQEEARIAEERRAAKKAAKKAAKEAEKGRL